MTTNSDKSCIRQDDSCRTIQNSLCYIQKGEWRWLNSCPGLYGTILMWSKKTGGWDKYMYAVTIMLVSKTNWWDILISVNCDWKAALLHETFNVHVPLATTLSLPFCWFFFSPFWMPKLNIHCILQISCAESPAHLSPTSMVSFTAKFIRHATFLFLDIFVFTSTILFYSTLTKCAPMTRNCFKAVIFRNKITSFAG